MPPACSMHAKCCYSSCTCSRGQCREEAQQRCHSSGNLIRISAGVMEAFLARAQPSSPGIRPCPPEGATDLAACTCPSSTGSQRRSGPTRRRTSPIGSSNGRRGIARCAQRHTRRPERQLWWSSLQGRHTAPSPSIYYRQRMPGHAQTKNQGHTSSKDSSVEHSRSGHSMNAAAAPPTWQRAPAPARLAVGTAMGRQDATEAPLGAALVTGASRIVRRATPTTRSGGCGGAPCGGGTHVTPSTDI
jgi:hypothetical protein